MKTIYKYFIFVIFLFGCHNDSDFGMDEMSAYAKEVAEIQTVERPKDAYNYPEIDWSNLPKNSDKRINAFQIPEKVVQKMSTEALVQAIIELPILFEVTAYLNYPNLESVEKLNCYKELCNRKDAASVMTNYFLGFDFHSSKGKLMAFVVPGIFAYICGQKAFVDQYSKEEEAVIFLHIINEDKDKWNKEWKDEDGYSGPGSDAWFLVHMILEKHQLIENPLAILYYRYIDIKLLRNVAVKFYNLNID